MTPKMPASKLTPASVVWSRQKPRPAKTLSACKIKIENSLDFARFESRFRSGELPHKRSLPALEEPILTASSDILQRNRNVVALIFRIRFERVIENVERFIEISAGMFVGGHADAETNCVAAPLGDPPATHKPRRRNSWPNRYMRSRSPITSGTI